MLRSSLKQATKVCSRTNSPLTYQSSIRTFSIGQFNTPNSHAPLVERYRPTWPDADFEMVNENALPPLPPRTVPDELFVFDYRTTSHKGTAKFYNHLMVNPADIRVKAQVSLVRFGYFKNM